MKAKAVKVRYPFKIRYILQTIIDASEWHSFDTEFGHTEGFFSSNLRFCINDKEEMDSLKAIANGEFVEVKEHD